VAADPVKVLVLYSHPLMGEGLGRMLEAEPGIVVYAVDIAEQTAVDEALAQEPAVIVVEEGGRVDAADVVRRSNCQWSWT
jgi:DNA-binding NarL/FixJ family response regulator